MHSYESADAVFGNRDLLAKILHPLPVKDLIRSKCVCKNWRYLISEPQFCYKHTLGLCCRQNNNTYLIPSGFLHQINTTCLYPEKANSLLLKEVGIIPFTNNSKNRFIHLDVHDEFDGQLCYYFIRSCNGLLLWKTSPTEFPTSSLYGKVLQECSFYVSNPTTGHCVRIDSFGHDFNASFSDPFLAFEPWKSPHYKVIFFSKVVGATKMKVSIYSSEMGSWSKHDVVPSFPNDTKILKNDGVYFNGAIHWYVLPENYTIDAHLSVYFDIDRLCLKNLPTLPYTVPYNVIAGAHFVECRGNLHMICMIANSYFDQELLRYDIFELKEDYSGWIQKYNINMNALKATCPRTCFRTCFRSCVESLCVVSQPPNEDEEEESMLAILVVGKDTVVSYNLKDHTSRIIYQGEDGFYPSIFGGPYFIADRYFETLVSISPGYNEI